MGVLEFQPHMGIGGVRFGMSRAAVREEIGDGFREFQKTSTEPPACAHDDPGLHCYFGTSGWFEGPIVDVVVRLSEVGVPIERDSDGSVSSFGISLYAPTGTVEGVLVTGAS